MEISIIVAIYNVEKYIDKCLESIIKVGHRVKEIICVDDGSTDNSLARIESYIPKDDRVKIISKNNAGVSSARNIGIREAQSEYVVFIDGDDYIEPSNFDRMLDQVEKYEHVDGVWTGYIRDDWNGSHIINAKVPIGLLDAGQIDSLFLPAIIGISYEKVRAWMEGKQQLNDRQEFTSVCRGIYSREQILKYKLFFDEELRVGEDTLFIWKYYCYAESMLVLEDAYYHYVWRDGSLTQTKTWFNLEQVDRQILARKQVIAARDAQKNELMLAGKPDYSAQYQGTLVLSKIQASIMLSRCKCIDFVSQYKKYLAFISNCSIEKAVRNFNFCCGKCSLKYKIAFRLACFRAPLPMFVVTFLINKFNCHVYPDE